jgi:hypothetical protein
VSLWSNCLTLSANAGDGEQLPLARHSLELCAAVLAELDAGAGDEILDRSGDDHLPGPRLGGYPRADVNSDPAHLPVELFTLAVRKNPSVFAPDDG